VTLAVITYVDRACVSLAKPHIQEDLGLDDTQIGWTFFVFGLAYALFEIPAGWMGDKMGPRRVLMRIVMFWSVFTAATGYAWNYVSLLVCRFCFGAGEAGAFPNMTKMFTIWLPQKERGLAQGITWLSARWGGAFTPLLVYGVMLLFTWRQTFLVFAGLGIVWAIVFYRWFRDNPRDNPAVNEAELAALEGAELNLDKHVVIPWAKFVRTPTVWLLWVYYFWISYVWYFYITWLPTYIKEVLHITGREAALLAGLPLFFGGIGCFLGGWAANAIMRRFGNLGRARRIVAVIGMLGAGIMLLLSVKIGNPILAMIAMGLSGFFNDLSMPCAWGACMDVGGKVAGSLSGSMNMMGNIGGALGPLVLPYLKKWSNENWHVPILAAAATYLISAACWVFIDPVTPLEKRR
jgi:MFS family permease